MTALYENSLFVAQVSEDGTEYELVNKVTGVTEYKSNVLLDLRYAMDSWEQAHIQLDNEDAVPAEPVVVPLNPVH